MTKVSIHRFFPRTRQVLWATGLGLGILTIGALAPSPSPSPAVSNREIQLQGERLALALGQVEQLWATVRQRPPGDLVEITYYLPDDTCDDFGERTEIAHPQHLDDIATTLLEDPRLALEGLDLVAYSVTRSTPNTIVIDFTIAPDSQRQLVSLSSCEQMMLFGSLRSTFLDNLPLGVEAIEFTEQGNPIAL